MPTPPTRARLLLGVSAAALLCTAATPSRAGGPTPFSAAWFAARNGGSGGGAAGGNAAAIAASQATNSVAAMRQVRQSLASLQQAAQAIAAMRNLQSSARAAAAVASVPTASVRDGLGAGGLQPDPMRAWSNAHLARSAPAVVGGRTKVTVTQDGASAILNWQTFNVGANTDLTFDQSAGGASDASWVALNRVNDPAARPSQILGTIAAPGHVYVINRNGIIFGATSQINTGALIASTADIDDAAFIATGIYGAGVFHGAAASSQVLVQAGAQITTSAAQSVTAGGGSVLLLGGAVENDGSISTPNGQAVLAAGQDFSLAQGYGTNNASPSTTLGTVVSIGTYKGGSVVNTGLIEATTGDISLVGRTITQAGVLHATTSVSTRGTIHLAGDPADVTGVVSLAPGSLTAIDPDPNSATALGAQRANAVAANPSQIPPAGYGLAPVDKVGLSRIEITGGTVAFGNHSLVTATAGQIAVTARQRIFAESGALIDASGLVGVSLPMSDNNLAVNIQGFELRDSPVNRDNTQPGSTTPALGSANVALDLRDLVLVAASAAYPTDRYYTPGGLLEVSGYLGNVQHSIFEWSTIGGTVSLTAPQVVAQPGSVFNVAGGTLQYQPGTLKQSWLIGSNGLLYNVNTAPANITYTGVFDGFTSTHPRWNVSNTYQDPLIAPAQISEQGYTVGRDAGSVTINAATVVFEGAVDGGVVNGARQSAAHPATVADPFTLGQNVVALGGSLQLANSSPTQISATEVIGDGLHATDVVIGDGSPALAGALGATAPIPGDRVNTAYLSAAALAASGLASLTVITGLANDQPNATTGSITVAAPLTLAPGGQVALRAASVAIDASITARGGTIAATTSIPASSTTTSLGSFLTNRVELTLGGKAQVTLAADATLDARGIWTNTLLDPLDLSGFGWTNGGNVVLQSSQGLTLAAGSAIDVSSGAGLTDRGATRSGAGGNVMLIAGSGPVGGNTDGEPLVFGATIRGYGAAGGGTLTIAASSVAIGALPGTPPAGLTLLPTALFGSGFTTYDITGYGNFIDRSGVSHPAVAVLPGTQLQLTAPVYQFSQGSYAASTGSDPAAALDLVLPPVYVESPTKALLTQRAGASLALHAGELTGTSNLGGDVSVGAGSLIAVDPLQSVTIDGALQLTVEGTIHAPSGKISILNDTLANDMAALAMAGYVPGLSIWLGSRSVLDVSAEAATALDQYGRVYGVVPNAGSIALGSLNAQGFVIARPGALLAASGASATIDRDAGLAVTPLPGRSAVPSDPAPVASNGGSIAMTSYNGIVFDGTMRAAAGGPGATGGTLSLTVENLAYPRVYGPAQNLQTTIPDEIRVPREIVIDPIYRQSIFPAAVKPGDPHSFDFAGYLIGKATLGVDQIAAGGFDTVVLSARDAIAFSGNVALGVAQSIQLTTNALSDTVPDGQVSIAAPYVKLASLAPLPPTDINAVVPSIPAGGAIAAPCFAGGSLCQSGAFAVSANQIDVSNGVNFGAHGTIELNPVPSSSGGMPTPAQRAVDLFGFEQATFSSQGDIRFLPGAGTPVATTTVLSTGDITLAAARIYTVTDTMAEVVAGVDLYGLQMATGTPPPGASPPNAFFPAGTLTLRTTGADPGVPFSANGGLALAAANVVQGGVVRQPLGSIQLGTIAGAGLSLNVVGFGNTANLLTTSVSLLPGSVTSVSAAGATIPYGGTADGVSYSANGVTYAGTTANLLSLAISPQITLAGQTIVGEAGAVLDLSGGGVLSGGGGQTLVTTASGSSFVGQGFISGRGGSTDVLYTPLPSFTSATGTVNLNNADKIFAILPGQATAYAPVTPYDLGINYAGGNLPQGESASYAGTQPAPGQQIDIPAGVPGLPAGTYTLYPSYYALLPGAYRVEITSRTTPLVGAVSQPDGSTLVAATPGIANTAARSSLPVWTNVMPGSVVRTYSQYNEETYAQFVIAQAALFSARRTTIPADAATLSLQLQPSDPLATTPPTRAFTFDGTALFAPAAGGYGGTVTVGAASVTDAAGNQAAKIEITGDAATPTIGTASVAASALDALGAETISIGVVPGIAQNQLDFSSALATTAVTIRDGAVLRAPQVFLGATASTGFTIEGVTVEPGAEISTIGLGPTSIDSSSGLLFAGQNSSVLAVSNGLVQFVPPNAVATAPITIQAGAQLYAGNTLTFSTTGTVSVSPGASYGARVIDFAVGNVNIGDTTTAPAGTVLPGLALDQPTLNALLAGGQLPGVPALQQLTLTASQSINVFGSVALNAGGAGAGLQQLVLNTPAIYGAGGQGDAASISASMLYWNGIASTASSPPVALAAPPVIAGGAGSGSGALTIDAQQIVLGYGPRSQPVTTISLQRTLLGFSAVALNASQQLTIADRGALSVYQAQGAYTTGAGYAYTGGALSIATPLITAAPGGSVAITAGGPLSLSAPAGLAPSASGAGGLGGELDVTAAAIADSTATVLPSGRVALTATAGDVTLGAGARIDVSGRTTGFFDVSRDSFGGTVALASATGAVSVDPTATIDLSAGSADAGSLSVSAALAATLSGAISGGAASGYASGSISVRGASLGDFADLNRRLNAGGVFGARSFAASSGDLRVGNDPATGAALVRAQSVDIAANGGALVVDGTIDASGAAPGSIRLSGQSLTVDGTLDAHGTVLQTDSYGQPIDAKNRASVELTAASGILALGGGAIIDVSSPELPAQGTVTLNTSRASETGGGVLISAPAGVTIEGAAAIVLDAFWKYAPTDANGTVVADNTAAGAPRGAVGLAQIDAASRAFIAAAAANGGLRALAPGLAAYGAAAHLRPGVEIDSATQSGNLTIAGELDLSGYRYGPGVNPAVPGSGEPGALVLRAGGNLIVNGSLSDGFGAVPATIANPDDDGWVLLSGAEPFGSDVYLPQNAGGILLQGGGERVVSAYTSFPNDNIALNYAVPLRPASITSRLTLAPDVVIPAEVILGSPITVPAGAQWVTTAPIYADPTHATVEYGQGAVLSAGTTLQAGWVLGAGSMFPVAVALPKPITKSVIGSDRRRHNVITNPVIWPAGATLGVFTTKVYLSNTYSSAGKFTLGITLPGGAYIPAGTVVRFSTTRGATPTRAAGGTIEALAPLLGPGTMSWSMRLVSGADLSAADTRAVALPASLAGSGNVLLADTHYGNPTDEGSTPAALSGNTVTPSFSVIRTGAADLDLIAGGNISQSSTFGVYTAGAQASGVTPDFEQPRGYLGTATDPATGATVNVVLGADASTGAPYSYEPLAAGSDYQAYYPTGGGNVLVSAQGSVSGYIAVNPTFGANVPASDAVGNWLWRQGGLGGSPAAWWVNFGAYSGQGFGEGPSIPPVLVGFAGVGALGGGNVSVLAGGALGQVGTPVPNDAFGTAVSIVSGGSGRVTGAGLTQTGGGDVTVRAGGGINPALGPNGGLLDGTWTDLRGNISGAAGSIGQVGLQFATPVTLDPRAPEPFTARAAISFGGIILVPGDGTARLATRGDLVLAGAGDATRLDEQNLGSVIAADGTLTTGIPSWFTLWRPGTAIDLFSAGGNITPTTQAQDVAPATANDAYPGSRISFPPTLLVTAASGSVYYDGSPPTATVGTYTLELMPAPIGQAAFLAAGSIYANATASGSVPLSIDLSGADPAAAVPTPANPAYGTGVGVGPGLSNLSPNGDGTALSLFALGPDTPTTNLHAGDPTPARFYAAGGDLVAFGTGDFLQFAASANVNPSNWYIGAKPVRILAAQDIVALGSLGVTPSLPSNLSAIHRSLVLNGAATDISLIESGRDIIYANADIAGPGLLAVQSGRNLYQANQGVLESIGPIVNVTQGSRNGGAGITTLVGVGAEGPDWTGFAARYLDPANQADPATPLQDQPGKVVATYQDQLLAWLQTRFGYGGTAADALAYFDALPVEQRSVFLLQVYFAELNLSGLEYNDPASRFYKSYLRGDDAVTALLPASRRYGGDLTMFSAGAPPKVTDGGIRTDFGGALTLLVPGGQTIVGVSGVTPGTDAGLLTQGSGDIDIYSDGSVLLGQSRIFTTFGGGILIWSAHGDINAGRGAKSTVVSAPQSITYSNYGDVILSPTVPSTGAGIATLNPIPSVPAGDVNLVAPFGVIDAGEAGIRASGNANLAALTVVNAANIQVQGKTTGVPVIAVPNVAAAVAAAASAGSAVNAAQLAQARPQQRTQAPAIITVEVVSYGGGGQDTGEDDQRRKRR